mgnify:CR=1 FL=1
MLFRSRQIVHRLLVSFPALLGVLFLCFCLLQVVPADPAMIIAGPDAKAETIAGVFRTMLVASGAPADKLVEGLP